jgi:DNA-binding NarL/FixJ family response regulator
MEPKLNNATISLLIADDHPLILAGMTALIEAEPDFQLLGRAHDAAGAVEQYMALRPDMLLIDLNMPGGGLDAIVRIRAFHPDARVVVLTAYEGDEDVHRALHAGACAYLLKQYDFEEIASCIRRVMRDGRYIPSRLANKLAKRVSGNALSKRELEILAHLSAGKSNKVIALTADIGVGTVKFHVNNILSKLNVSSRTEAAFVAQQRGLIHSF